MRTAIQGVIVAVKKKSSAKRVAKKAPAKRVVKKSTAKRVVKKAAAKKSSAKKRVVKKSVTKKSTAKRVVKKSAAKKRVTKKAPTKRAVKRSVGSSAAPRVAVSTTPATPVALAPRPVATPKQATSGRVIFLVVAGIVILAAIVMSQSGSESEDGATPAPSMSQSAQPSESATAEPTEPVAAVEAPSKFVALKSADGLMLRWVAPMAMDGLTGYNVEIRANGEGDWSVIATVPTDQLTQSVTKSGDSGWTQFRVTSVYSDGQSASATVFGIPGEFK